MTDHRASIVNGPQNDDVVASSNEALLICFSHLRWSFVKQRPQHLMSRFAAEFNVVIWEEPLHDADCLAPELNIVAVDGVTVVTPKLPGSIDALPTEQLLKTLLDDFIADRQAPCICWYYTPMMLGFSRHLKSECIVYDCMDELANFNGAPPELLERESELLARADLVFTGGYTLYEAKRPLHSAVYPFPSSVDRAHFNLARNMPPVFNEQRELSRPRLGYFGVIDERIDSDLIAAIADARPDWSIIMIGPVVKIDPASLPQRANIAWLGQKEYAELPNYLGGWDVALMPFAINAATKFISPTKTPEYLAGGVPVVSTPITDVIRHYGGLAGVRIAGSHDAFIAACEEVINREGNEWLEEADNALRAMSWDNVFNEMARHIKKVRQPKLGTPSRHYDYLIVGAGFAGAVMAERLASQSNKSVLLIDRRPHVAGNAFDHYDAAGILVHKYGPHIFHTNSTEVFEYLSQFTDWRHYEHRVLASVDDKLVPMPINRTTLNSLYNLSLSTREEAEAYLETRAEYVPVVRTSEDVVVSKVGRQLYESFFQGYTRKQWGVDPSKLDKSVTARVPTRTDTDDRYFTDKYQVMPKQGYTRMFERMLDHPLIHRQLGVDFNDLPTGVSYDRLIYTGPIDEYFGHRFGKLPYRSLEFQHQTLDCEQYQPVGVVNYPNEKIMFTRITEYKHLTGQVAPKTSITYEVPRADGDPYYPIPRPENQALFKRYEELADLESDVTFVGRLATYKYYNMDQVVGQALATHRRLSTPNFISKTDAA